MSRTKRQTVFILQRIGNKFIHFILIMLVGTDVSIRVIFVCEETKYAEETHLLDLVAI